MKREQAPPENESMIWASLKVFIVPTLVGLILGGVAMIILVLTRGTQGFRLNIGPFVVTDPPVGTAICGILLMMTTATFTLYWMWHSPKGQRT